ncbi:CYB5 [Candida oxycetoniae]|uniref:CYB5 n=1 Tax=Candida oxycetoniae TaxID=497107 RepID=A0AAI9T0V6_9ASCO|nr:CYB5 [Candida oxycetoniae]KAI3406567.1 CYB5 [Candida oxycetoniae]
MSSEVKVFDADEISKHTTHDDCWVVINGRVYNVSSYIDEHPGGEEVLLDVAGSDATEAFDDIGHSDEAHEILAKLFIGNLKGAKPVEAKRAQSYKSEEGSVNVPLIAVVVFLLAFGAYYYKTNF